jgi:hypothetical protein
MPVISWRSRRFGQSESGPNSRCSQLPEMDAHGDRCEEVKEGGCGAPAVDQAGIGGAAEEGHEHLCPLLVAEFEGEAGQGEPQEAGDDYEMEEYVQPVKAPVLLMAVGNDVMTLTLVQCRGLFAVFHKTPEHPEKGMDPEDREDEEEETGHEDEGVIEDRVFFTVIMLAVGIVCGKERRRLAVALAAGLDDVVRIDAGFGVAGRKDFMGGVAVGAPSDLFRKAETVVLAVIAVHVGLDRHSEHLVASHHLFVCMAFHADFRMEFPVLMGLGITKRLDFMEVMAVVAGRGILGAGCNRLAVDGVAVDRLPVVALDALGDNDPFVVFPVFVGVDIGMAIGAHDTFCSVDAEIVFGCLFFVASVALDFPDFHFALHMLGKIDYLHMATGAGIFTVNRCGEFRGAYLV